MPLDLTKLRTVRQFVEEYPAFSANYWRYLISQRTQNGIESCLIRVGARIFIDTEAFTEWVQGQRCAHRRGIARVCVGEAQRATAARAGHVDD